MHVILDSSVILSALLADEQTAYSLMIFEKLQSSAIKGVISAISISETGNGLLMAYRRNRLDKKDLTTALYILPEMPFILGITPDINTIATTAEKHQLSFYDAIYLQMAINRQAPLASLDSKLVQAAQKENLYYQPA